MNRRRPTPKKNLRQIAFSRFMLVVAIFALWIGGIAVRLVHLQVQQHDFLNEQAERQRREVKKARALRGTIYDREGRILAMSHRVSTLYADATEMADMRASAKRIARVTGLNENSVLKQLTSAKSDGRRFLPLVKGLDDESVQKFNRELEQTGIAKSDQPKFEGLHWREDQRRSYPQQTIGAHVVGMSNAEGVGQAGIEQSQNDVLYGPVIKRIQERDRFGRVYDERLSEQEPPSDVVLTLDISMQYAAEQALANTIERTGAKAAMAVVLDNATGEVLAMANYPTFDPNKIGKTEPEFLKNGIVQNVYSPGSVFKLITYGSALEKKLITPDAEIDSGNGVIDVAGHVFRDSHAIGRVTYAKALAHSSNVCAIKTSMRVGREDFNGLIRKMGFGKPTGVELPAETAGIVRPIERWNGDSMASMSIGYEIGVTALQMANAFATIANDGVRNEPRIIKEIRRADGSIERVGGRQATQVVSRETARDLKRMLSEVVTAGTGKRAQLDRYTSAGKTGAAWKFDPQTKRINSSKYVSSFIGFAPADNPRVTIAVVVDEPRLGGRDGGSAAAPAFKEIADQILPQLQVPPDKEMMAEAISAANENIEEVPAGGTVVEKPKSSSATETFSPRHRGAGQKPANRNSSPPRGVAKNDLMPGRRRDKPEVQGKKT